jgi:hypothetical protein
MDIDRKFLVTELPMDLEQCQSEPVDQGYIAVTDDGVEVRIRRRGDDASPRQRTGHPFALLNVIGAREGAIQQELGAAMGIDRTTMVALIDQLEDAGLAERRPSKTDRRAREVTVVELRRRD